MDGEVFLEFTDYISKCTFPTLPSSVVMWLATCSVSWGWWWWWCLPLLGMVVLAAGAGAAPSTSLRWRRWCRHYWRDGAGIAGVMVQSLHASSLSMKKKSILKDTRSTVWKTDKTTFQNHLVHFLALFLFQNLEFWLKSDHDDSLCPARQTLSLTILILGYS